MKDYLPFSFSSFKIKIPFAIAKQPINCQCGIAFSVNREGWVGKQSLEKIKNLPTLR
jgi:hypothetical protein